MSTAEPRFINGADLEVLSADGRLVVRRAATKADCAHAAALLGALSAVMCFVLFCYARRPDSSAWLPGRTDGSEILGLLLLTGFRPCRTDIDRESLILPNGDRGMSGGGITTEEFPCPSLPCPHGTCRRTGAKRISERN
jgi:hypothetical protein